MNDIPASVREFDRWFAERSSGWPPELQLLGSNAQMSLTFLDQPEANRTAKTNEMARQDLLKFAEAYGRWTEWVKRR